MRAIRYLGIAALIAALSSLGLISQASAMRTTPTFALSTAKTTTVTPFDLGDPYFDIVSLGYYCNQGGTSCYDTCPTTSKTAITCPGLDFAGVEAVGNDPHANFGIPGELAMECGQTLGNGDVVIGWLDVYNWGSSAQYVGSNGVIGGKATLLSPNTYESDNATSATSSIQATGWASDFTSRGSVTGVQNTDNSAHALMNGGFRITITGVLHNITTDHYYLGTMSCYAGGPAMMALASDVGCSPSDDESYAPFAAEGVLEPYAGDEYHTYNDLGPDSFYYLQTPQGLSACAPVYIE